MRAPRRGWALGCLLCLATGSIGASAHAQPRVVVLDFDGPKAKRMRSQVVKALAAQQTLEFVPKADAYDAASQAGVDISTAEGRAVVAEELLLSALVSGYSSKSGRRIELNVLVFEGSSGEEVGGANFRGNARQIGQRIKRRLWGELSDSLTSAQAPEPQQVEEEPTEEAVEEAPWEQDESPPAALPEEQEDEEEASDEDSDEASEWPALELSAGMRFMSRSFSYQDFVLQLADYWLPPYPAAQGQLRWYPAAHFTDGFLAHLGLDLAYTHVLSPSSERDGLTFGSTASALRIGARGRLPLGRHELALAVGYAAQSFRVDDAQDGTDPGLPAVSYSFLRMGPELRVGITDAIYVHAEVAYLLALGFGEIASDSWFPNTSGMGIDVGLRVSWRLLSLLEVYGGASFRQVGMTFDPQPADRGAVLGRVAGGATDRYITPEFGVTLRL
ncbi:MAG: hypothetical protein OXU20_19000 [Myxococcales bacterium]|nr:hypothetical protein [Myxococcales bacterium]